MPIEQAELAVEVFRMLSDTTRVRLLWALIDQELPVNELAARVDKPAPSVSQHLAVIGSSPLSSRVPGPCRNAWPAGRRVVPAPRRVSSG